jgi:hypothetical protein
MRQGLLFRGANFANNILLFAAILLAGFGTAWEYSTRWYLSGFANAVLPFSSSSEQKVSAILAWMEQGPQRQSDYYSDDNQNRDPVDTLNYRELLSVCGTATNAFVNLASAGGIEARRLLLLNPEGMSTNHVVAEVYLDGRWVVVDPTFHVILRDSAGHLLTRQELARPEIFQDATKNIPRYDPGYNYEHAAFLHVARLPVVGHFLQIKLNTSMLPWQERINWTILMERQSYATIVVGIALFCLAMAVRSSMVWFGRRYSLVAAGPWEQLRRGGIALFTAAPAGVMRKRIPAA